MGEREWNPESIRSAWESQEVVAPNRYYYIADIPDLLESEQMFFTSAFSIIWNEMKCSDDWICSSRMKNKSNNQSAADI